LTKQEQIEAAMREVGKLLMRDDLTDQEGRDATRAADYLTMLRHNRLDRPVVILQPTLETSEERLNQAWKKDGEIIGNAMAERVREMAKETTAKPLTCGCVVCTCEDEVRCQGCGAKYCEQHAVNRSDAL
jgi:hypothetical protein